MKPVVFLGPSLPCAEAKAILDADYRPPAAQGDVYRAARRLINAGTPRPTLAIIDGYFEQAPAVWHKEILWALEHGIAVAGASSMGAMRAAELAPFGMIGVGRVFEAYRHGLFSPFSDPFDGDDEVAVAHGPAELGYPGAPALVDLRHALASAAEDGIIEAIERDTWAEAAKALFFKDRTWARILADVDPKRADAFLDWLKQRTLSVKADDARALLRHLADGQVTPPGAPVAVEQTDIWMRASALMIKEHE